MFVKKSLTKSGNTTETQHHPADFARSHTAREIIDYLKDKNIELMSYYPYSPDLSPNEFFLIHGVKQRMQGLQRNY